MRDRVEITSGSVWETRYGYARAVRSGSQVFVSGTTAIRDGTVVGIGDARLQTERIFEIIEDALRRLGGSLEDIVRLRVYTTDIARAAEIGEVLGQTFRDRHPAATMVEVSRLIDPDLLVEVEADAIFAP